MTASSPVEALNALSISQAVTANNLANVGTEGFKASRVALETGPGGQGVRVQEVRQDFSAGVPVPQDRGIKAAATAGTSTTDTAREIVRMIPDSRAFEANAAATRTIEETTGHILDLLI
jgi:flagellar basal-body rod protein FlgC